MNNEQILTKRFTKGAGTYTGSDWNDLKTPGCWLVLNDGKENAPTQNTWCTAIVFMGGTGAYVQIAISAANYFYIRHFNGKDWLSWHQF